MKTKKVYECGICIKQHNTYKKALNCCHPQPEAVYVCGECGYGETSQENADACCHPIQDALGINTYSAVMSLTKKGAKQ